MHTPSTPLLRHLALVLLVKLLALVALWWFFVRDARHATDVQATSQHIVDLSRALPPSSSAGTRPQGASR